MYWAFIHVIYWIRLIVFNGLVPWDVCMYQFDKEKNVVAYFVVHCFQYACIMSLGCIIQLDISTTAYRYPHIIWMHSNFAYCINKTIYLERKICTVLGEVQPLGGLIYAPLTLYQAREKSLTNHFAPSAQPQQPSSTLFVRSLKGSRVKKTTSVLHVLNSMNRVLYNVRECQFLELWATIMWTL